MKIHTAFVVLLILVVTSTVNAASLKSLSEKLSSSSVKDIDNTKEKIPNNNDDNDVEDVVIDENVDELDKLKNHKQTSLSFVENLEGSLRKLQASNHHHHNQHEQLAISQQFTSEAPTNVKVGSKENLENIPLSDEVTTTTATNNNNKIEPQRRSSLRSEVTFNPSTMLRQRNGKYSAYDMSQYIFWTGDEEGVAKAVEELIDENLMSRENAIEFLNDVRVGIDYLENIYSLKEDDSKINTQAISRFTPPSSSTIKSTATPTVDLPINFNNYNYQKFHSLFKAAADKEKMKYDESEAPTLSPAAILALERIPALMKLTESHKVSHYAKQDPIDDEVGRSRLSEFISGEYSLEEVIYQLAKTMFSQSLTHASSESQVALQKLTEFLENEGKRGRISTSLQKKILDVLLAALSDTLNENPEIMEKARHAMTAKK